MYRDPADVGTSDYHRSSPTHVRLDRIVWIRLSQETPAGQARQSVSNGKCYTLFDTGWEEQAIKRMPRYAGTQQDMIQYSLYI